MSLDALDHGGPAGPPYEHGDVSRALTEVAAALRTATEAAVRPLGLSVAQYSCLELLRRDPGSSGADVARASGVSRQSTHVLLRGMERDGLVRRGNAPGRSMAWSVTALGRRRLRDAGAAVGRVDATVLGSLDDERLALLVDLLRECADGLGPVLSLRQDLRGRVGDEAPSTGPGRRATDRSSE